MFIFGVKWEIEYFSVKGAFQTIDTVLEVIGFSMATLCLSRAQNFLVRFTSIGYLLVVASDFIIRYHVISGEVPYLSSLESIWVLGLILMSMGFFLIKDSCDERLFKLFMINSLQSQIGIWLLILWLISVFMFAGACCFFSQSNEFYLSYIAQNFLSMLVPFSVLAITSSSYIAAKISSPLSILESKINEFLLTETYQKELPNLAGYYISEFKALEDFILGSFVLYQKKHIAEVNFAKIAAQVSHDIRSPLAAINTVLDVTVIPDNRRLLIKNASNRINDIANNLLMSSKNIFHDISCQDIEVEKNNDMTTELMFVILDNIVAEKRYEYYQSKIDIQLRVDEKSYNCFSEINLTSFNRVLSNLVNNSVESLNGKGHILLSLEASSDYIEISIKDNGCGIPTHVIKKITAEGFSFNKKNGAGFGLSHAQKYIEQIKGTMLIESKENTGTQVLIRLAPARQPSWFCQNLDVNSNAIIVILDGDLSIHNAWDERFSNASNNIILQHLYHSSDLSKFIENNNIQVSYYLIDYDLLEGNKSGLDFIDELGIHKNAILVTSYFEPSLRERCARMAVRIIPKSYIPFIQINWGHPQIQVH